MRKAFFFLALLIMASTLSVSWKQTPLAASSTELTEVETTPFVTFHPIDHLGGEIRALVREGDYLYVASGVRLIVIDVSSPNYPRPAGEPVEFTSVVVGVALRGNHIYAALGSNGLAIISKNNPERLELLSVMTDLAPRDVAIENDRLYVQQSGEVNVFDLSEPANPQELGQYGSVYGTVFSVVDQHIYVQDGSELIIIDATDAFAPLEVSRTQVGYLGAFSIANSHAYLVNDDNQLMILDVSDPSSPAMTGSLSLPWFVDNVAVIGEHAYLDMGEIYVIDVSNPAQPSAAGRLSVARHGRLEVGELFRTGDDLVVTDANRSGIHLMDRRSNPAWPDEMGVLFQPAARVHDSVIDDGKLYLAVGDGGFQTIDLSSPRHLQQIIQFRSPTWTPVPDSRFYIGAGTTQGIAVAGDHVYLANGSGGLHIVDIHSLEDPQIAGVFSRQASQPNDARDVVVRNGIAYIADGQNGLLVVDVSDPEAPEELTTLDTTPAGSSEAAEVSLVGSYLALNNRHDSLDLYSLANPRQPVLSSQWNESINVVAVRDPYIFLGKNDGLRILSITSDGQLQDVGTHDRVSVHSLYVAEDELYLNTEYTGFQVMDVSNPANPVLRGTFAGTGRVHGVDKQVVYVADNGLSALYRMPGVKGVIDGGGVLSVPEDGISYAFEADVFSAPVEIRHTLLKANDLPPLSSKMPLFGPFQVEALMTGEPVSPTQPYTITLELNNSLSTAVASGLALHSFDGEQWAPVANVEVHNDRRTVSMAVEQTGTFVLSATPSSRVLLPHIARNARGSVDLAITGIEVTQATQNLENGVPLTANRPTVARIYSRVAGPDVVDDVMLTLRATRDGAPLAEAITVGPRAVFSRVERDTPFTSFDIRLPDSWLQGNVTLTAEIGVQQRVPEVDEQNNTRSVTVAFTPLEPLRVVVVPVNYTDTARGVFCPAPDTEDLYSDGLQRFFPVHAVELSFRAPINFSGDLVSEDSRLLEEIAAIKNADDAPAAVVYYGVFSTRNPGGDYCRAGAAGMGYIGLRASIGVHSRSTDEVSRIDSAGGLAAHEFGHNFGLRHVACPVVTPDYVDLDYPYDGASIGQVGYDVLRGRIWSPDHPDYATDIMSYCFHDWFSDYHYTRLFRDQQANGQINVASASPELLVRASITGETIALRPTYVLTRTASTSAAADSPYVIELVGDAQDVLASHPVVAYQVADTAGHRSIFASLPVPERPVTTIRLLHNGEIVASRRLDGQQLSQPEADPTLTTAEDGAVLRWNRAQTPVLVRYTTDRGATWTTLAIDEMDGELQLDNRQLPDEPALFEVRSADTMALQARTVSFAPATEKNDE